MAYNRGLETNSHCIDVGRLMFYQQAFSKNWGPNVFVGMVTTNIGDNLQNLQVSGATNNLTSRLCQAS